MDNDDRPFKEAFQRAFTTLREQFYWVCNWFSTSSLTKVEGSSLTKGLRRSWTVAKNSDDDRLPSTSDASKLRGPRWTKTRRACTGTGTTYCRQSLDPAAAATLRDDSWKVRPSILHLHLALLNAFILLNSHVFHITMTANLSTVPRIAQ